MKYIVLLGKKRSTLDKWPRLWTPLWVTFLPFFGGEGNRYLGSSRKEQKTDGFVHG